MTTNPIDEIKRIRHQLGGEADFDVHRIFDTLRDLQANSGRTYARGAPKLVAQEHLLETAGGSEGG